jgi:phosphomethylpyrimidine synthase
MKLNSYGIKNKVRNIEPLTIGERKPTRVVTNIGLTPKATDLKTEFKKALASITAGSDVVSDVSIANNYRNLLLKLIKSTEVPIATVPLYGVCINSLKNNGSFVNFKSKDILNEIEYQAQIGVDIMTIHATLTLDLLRELQKSSRIIKIPSRGGALIAANMITYNQENQLYVLFEDILDIMKKYDITISIGSCLRPGSIIDGLDKFYLKEIEIQSRLVEKAINKKVKTMVEGVGHLSLDIIPFAIKLQKLFCHNVPIRPLPICTDRAAGHDDIASAIAATICAINGAEIISVITKGEHIGLPRINDLIEGVKSTKIACHIADIIKINDIEKEKKISIARCSKRWDEIYKYALYPKDAKALHKELSESKLSEEGCTMCSSLCALDIVNKYFSK